MTARAFLPHTNSRPLMVVVIILVTLCAAQTMFSLIDLFANPNWGPLIMAALSSLLGVGLWRLHPIARGVAVLLLWVLIIVLIGGTINPFTKTLMVYNYELVFRDLRVGLGAALSYLVLLMSLGVGVVFIVRLYNQGIRDK